MRYKKALAALLILISTSLAASAAPAISNGSFDSGTTGWTAFGGTLTSNPDSLITASGQTTSGLITGSGSSGYTVTDLRTDLAIHGATPTSAFMNQFTPGGGSAAQLSGAYQVFSTTTTGTISLSAEFFSNGDAGFGDPFIFLYDRTNSQFITLRGDGIGNGGGSPGNPKVQDTMSSASISGTSLRGAATGTTPLPTGYDTSYGEFTITFNNVLAGDYVIGFGVGAPNGGSVPLAMAVTNIISPNNVPEIDTNAAGLPVAISLLVLMLVFDRRRRINPAIGTV